jgi:hypothetical protein
VLDQFREVVVADAEFTAIPGERSGPVCMVAREMRSGRIHRIFKGQFGPTPPYPTGPDVLFVAFVAPAELGVYQSNGWPMPERVLDLYAEFRNHTNMGSKEDQASRTPAGRGLLGASAFFGLPLHDADAKKAMQQAIGSDTWQGRHSPEEIMDYCQSDQEATARLLVAMLPKITNLPQAVYRGRYMKAAAVMEQTGPPIDVEMFERLRQGWPGIKDRLIDAVDADYGVYENGAFRHDRFAAWLVRQGIPWPRLASGKLDLDDKRVFRQQAKAYPAVAPLRELRHALSEMRLNDLAVGHDGRNRTSLWAFGSLTGRNTPGNTKFIFGPSVWLRSLIKPPPGYAVAYVDWAQQEFGIAAALSGDLAMQAAYRSGDPYLTFGKQAGAIPADATKETHGVQRELFKQCVLGVQYGMEEHGLAARIDRPPIVARELLKAHRQTFAQNWRWSDHLVMYAMKHSLLQSVFGWTVHIGHVANERSLRNFPMQANGAEMMRLAVCLAIERGIVVCCPVHDAFLLMAPLDRIDHDVAVMRECMAEASLIVLDGFELGTDVSITRYPDRYVDKRGVAMWKKVMHELQIVEQIRMSA